MQRVRFRMLQVSEDCARKLYEKKPHLSPKKQRPQQTFKRRAEPANPESTVTTNETKVAKGLVKSSGAYETPGSSRKPETKKQEEEKKSVLPAPVVPPLQGGHYELNSRMTKMVETELRDIMIKVWHELPDNPSDEVEALVVDKLKNKAGDDLRNVLGLNITKRLLNVHNPLYVKVQFSGKPEKVHLGEFLKKYNFTAFKRIEKTVNMFAAQVKTINDFDKICSAKDIRCGDIKVTVSPIYKFSKCPPNLVTRFYDQEEDVSDEPAETTEKDKKLEEHTEKIISPEKVVHKLENVLTKAKVEDTNSQNVTKVEKVVSKPSVEHKPETNKLAAENKIAENKTTVNKPAVNKPATEKKTTVNKPAAENKTTVNKPAAENKTTTNKPAAENKTTTNKPAAENTNTVNKPAVDKTATNKPSVENKTVNKTTVNPAAETPVVNKPTPEKPVNKPAVQTKPVTKPAVNKQTVVNKTVINKTAAVSKTANTKPVAKKNVENKDVKKPQVNPKTSDTDKKLTPSPAKTPSKAKADVKAGKPDKVDDYDELDDHDILALMSEGIVLDECSGSDDD